MKDERLIQMKYEIAVAGIAAVASQELLAAMLRKGDVMDIRAACEKNVYWPTFCAAVGGGKVPESWLPGAVGRCVLG